VLLNKPGIQTVRPKERYNFTIEDVAILTEQDVNTVRQHIHRKKFNPSELGSVVEYINTQRHHTPAQQIGYIQLLEREAMEN
jgi:hypothetical protein